jgi:hypothetical protein
MGEEKCVQGFGGKTWEKKNGDGVEDIGIQAYMGE